MHHCMIALHDSVTEVITQLHVFIMKVTYVIVLVSGGVGGDGGSGEYCGDGCYALHVFL